MFRLLQAFFLLIPAVGYVLTRETLQNHQPWYFFLTAVVWTETAAIVLLLRQRWLSVLPLWLMLAFFMVGYYAQFYWITLDPPAFYDMYWELPNLAAQPDNLIRAFATVTVGYSVFCLLSVVLLASSRDAGFTLQRPLAPGRYEAVSIVLFVCLPALIFVSAMVMRATGIAVMGAETVQLPFRLAGVIFYTRAAIGPLLALLLWASVMARRRLWVAAAVVLAASHGATDAMLRSSRGALALLALLLLFVLLVSEKLTGARVRAFALAMVIVVLSFPLLTAYRSIRALDPAGMSLGRAAILTLDQWWQAETSTSGMTATAVRHVVLRLNGISSILPIVISDRAPVDPAEIEPILRGEGVSRFFTVDILGVPREQLHTSAPTLLGWMYILGGHTLVVLATGAFVLTIWVVWRSKYLATLRSAPVARAVFLLFILLQMTEGTIEGLGLQLSTTLATVAFCELLIRIVPARRYAGQPNPPSSAPAVLSSRA